ncbi:transporter substrate-binding domain-containing protein [Streptomyces sp. NRRL F-5126]|uniref:ABC transporter substrate-binding protein n=1 Tax=Streptomyces sp. NRRL F-5126 TaxID=1463857 RepID=UPI00068B643D|nr:transporter substrate-binding domain-containing protein [Streptomyces sp. NRRL F-5126]
MTSHALVRRTPQRRTPQRRTVLAAATLGLLSLSLTACGGSGSSAASNKYGTISAGRIKFAYRSDDKPVSFIQNGQPAGFMVDLSKAVAAKMGLKAGYVATSFNSMLPDVRNHMYDAAAFGTLVTPDRSRQAAFTTAVGYSQARLLSLKKEPIATVAAANGKTVAITQGSELIPLIQKLDPKVVVKQFPSVAASTNALVAGQVDGLLTGVTTTQTLLRQHAGFTATPPITSGMSAFPVAKDRRKLLKGLNTALASVMTDGTYTKLYAKWNPPGSKIPQKLLDDYPGMKQVAAGSPSPS